MSNQVSARPTVVGTGLVTLDLILEDKTSAISWAAGGTCGNVLTVLALLGWKSFPVARLNGDTASKYVKQDFARWGLSLQYSALDPTTDTPIIAQRRHVAPNGDVKHKFSWECPHCGAGLPFYKAVPIKALEKLTVSNLDANVFYFDRPSPGALFLANHFRQLGSLIYFEPSAKGDLRILQQCINASHIVKYSEERFSSQLATRYNSENLLLEIQTLGKSGLRYRRFSNSRPGKWKLLPAEPIKVQGDTVGAGDWLSAGFISQIGRSSTRVFKKWTVGKLESALNYGQRLAAFNCGFEGARGSMYKLRTKDLLDELEQLKKHAKLKESQAKSKAPNKLSIESICPACP